MNCARCRSFKQGEREGTGQGSSVSDAAALHGLRRTQGLQASTCNAQRDQPWEDDEAASARDATLSFNYRLRHQVMNSRYFKRRLLPDMCSVQSVADEIYSY